VARLTQVDVLVGKQLLLQKVGHHFLKIGPPRFKPVDDFSQHVARSDPGGIGVTDVLAVIEKGAQ